MRMIHFFDRQSTEKNPELPAEIKENYEMQLLELQSTETIGKRLNDRSNSIWARFKHRLLAIIRRERL